MAKEILFPNGQVFATLMYIWSGGEPVVWDGNVNVVIAPGTTVTADQGAGGLSPWLITGTVNANVLGTVAVSNFPATQPVSGTVAVSNFPATQPISAASLPLPTGASTEAKQDTGNTSLASIKTNTDPLVTVGGGGYVRQDSNATIAKETGGNLATVKTNTDTLLEVVDSKADLLKTGSPTITNATSNATPVATAATTDVVSAPSSGNHLEIKRLHASNGSATAVKVSWKESGGTERYQANLPQYGIVSIDLDFSWHLTTATKLQMVTSAAGSIDWTVDYRTVPD